MGWRHPRSEWVFSTQLTIKRVPRTKTGRDDLHNPSGEVLASDESRLW